MPLLVSSSSATVRAGLEQLIDDEAARELVQLQHARDALSNTSILPWHDTLRATKHAALSLLDTQISALDAASHGADLKVLNALLTTTSG
jgi:monomeric isocitrate dehydrogenase